MKRKQTDNAGALAKPEFAEIRLLRVFRSVVDNGGFAAADAELNIGRSAISVHVAELEERLGVKLLERGRGRKQITLTDKGSIVYNASSNLYLALDKFRNQVQATHDQLSGRVSLGYVDQLSSHPDFKIAATIRRLYDIAPKIQLSLRTTTPNQIERRVLEGDLDIGIVVEYQNFSGIEYAPFIAETHNMYCGVGHALFDAPSHDINPDILSRYDHVSSTYSDYTRVLAKEFGVQPVMFANSAEAAVNLILSGTCVGILPAHYADLWVTKGKLRCLPIKELTFIRELKVILRRGSSSELLLGYVIAAIKHSHRKVRHSDLVFT